MSDVNTINDISSLIRAKDYVFQVSIPGRHLPFAKTTIGHAMASASSLEEYFGKLARTNNTRHLLIRTFTPNGTSHKMRGEYLILLDPPEPVATHHKGETKEPARALSGNEDAPIVKEKMDVNDRITFGVLQIKHDLLKEQNKKMEEELRQARSKIDTLQEERLQLVKDNTIHKEKSDLELERAKFDAEKNSKDGLGALVDYADRNPEIVKMIVGILKPDHPMFKDGNFSGTKEQKQISADSMVNYHTDADLNSILNDIPKMLSKAEPMNIAMLHQIFEKLISKPELIKETYNTLNPEHAAA